MKSKTLFFLLILFLSSSCDIAKNDVLPDDTFVKIYDDSRFEQEYYPLDVIQTADNGYLILSEVKYDQSLFTSINILKTDAMGDIVLSTQMPAPYVNAVGGLNKIDGNYYFVCMDSNNLSSQLVMVDNAGVIGDPVPLGGITYPLVSNLDANNIVLLSFDNSSGESVISVVSSTGQITQQASYSIGAGVDVEKPVIDHLTRNGPKLPFSVGKISGGNYYFNGFYNYTFSLVFSDFGASPTGVCQGQLSQGGISAISSLGGNNFGVARFNFGKNYINPLVSISTSSITSSTDLGGNIFPEIESPAKVKLLAADQDPKWIYGTHTQSKQLVFYGFEQASGNILGTAYL